LHRGASGNAIDEEFPAHHPLALPLGDRLDYAWRSLIFLNDPPEGFSMSNRYLIAALLTAGASLALAQNAAPPAQGGDQAHTDRMVRFKQIDKNRDSKLSLLEFQTRPSNAEAIAGTTPAAPDAKTMADRAARFKQGDKNNDGSLTYEEFKSLEDMPAARAPGNPGQGR
jgi:hypothetical protein